MRILQFTHKGPYDLGMMAVLHPVSMDPRQPVLDWHHPIMSIVELPRRAELILKPNKEKKNKKAKEYKEVKEERKEKGVKNINLKDYCTTST